MRLMREVVPESLSVKETSFSAARGIKSRTFLNKKESHGRKASKIIETFQMINGRNLYMYLSLFR